MATEIVSFTATPPLAGKVPRILARSAPALPLVLKIIAVMLFLPEEASFEVAGLRLTVMRVIFLALTPVVVTRLVQKMAARRYRFALSDLFVPLAGLWMIVGPANVIGTSDALSHGAPIALEFCIGYLITRTLLSAPGQALSFINLLCRVIAFVALLGLADPLTHHFFIRDLVGKLTGYSKGFTAENYEIITRMGVLRATSTLEHPIAFGIVCAVSLTLAICLPISARIFTIISCCVGVIISITSAAFQGMLIVLILLAYSHVTAGIRFRWMGLIILTAGALVMIYTFVDNPMGVIFRHLTFDDQDGYYRLFIWQTASAAVEHSPWFGIGFVVPEYYDIPTTVDSVWLESALTFGIPGSLLIAFSIMGAASLPTSAPPANMTAVESKVGTTLGMIIFLIIFWGFTVHYWGIDWILIALLTGVRAHLGELGATVNSSDRS